MNGKKPTREERKIFEKNGLDTYKWLIQKNAKDWMQVVNIETKEERVIQK